MPDLYVSRYVARTPSDLVADLGPAFRPARDLQVDTGVPARIHDWMWLVPVRWHRGETLVVEGQIRVIAVAGGRHAITEVLLVAQRTTAEALDIDALLDDLIDRAPLAASGPTAGWAA